MGWGKGCFLDFKLDLGWYLVFDGYFLFVVGCEGLRSDGGGLLFKFNFWGLVYEKLVWGLFILVFFCLVCGVFFF